MKKIALILCLVLVASFVLSGCNNSDSIITLEDREVGKIEIQSGVKAKLFCPEIAGLFCRIAGLFCHDSRANLSLKPVCFGIAIS